MSTTDLAAPATAADLAVDVRGLTKRFGPRVAVDGLSIQVARGRICGFLGPNGSGKTTTIRMLCGLLTPDAGEGTCLGYDIRRESRRIKLRVGYMTQRFGLYDDLTIEENLRFIARVYGVPDVKAAAAQAIARLGLADRRAQLAGTLSGGWKQRMALAACLLHEPQLLLLDEPTAGVDPKARRDFWAHIHQLADEGMTVLVSTHYMDEAERCHQIAYISFGKLLAAGTGDEILRASGLRTWDVTGSALVELSRRLNASGGWQVVPFGTRLHVTSRGADLDAWLAQHAADLALQVQEIAAGLEDLFISLMGPEADRVQ
jgi:ABC-2 type transport system ATP-binding protein